MTEEVNLALPTSVTELAPGTPDPARASKPDFEGSFSFSKEASARAGSQR